MTRLKYFFTLLEDTIRRANQPQQKKGVMAWIRKPKPAITSFAVLTAALVAAVSLYYTIESSEQLGELPRSLARFDSTVTGMSDIVETQQQQFSGALDSLTRHLHRFAGSLEDYKGVIDSTIVAYNRHLDILEKHREQIEKELNRKSDLRMGFEVTVTDSGFWEVKPVVVNYGNAATGFFYYYFDLPDSLGFCEGKYNVAERDSMRSHYTFRYNKPMGFEPEGPGSKSELAPVYGQFILRNPPKNEAVVLKYGINYQHGSYKDSIPLSPNR